MFQKNKVRKIYLKFISSALIVLLIFIIFLLINYLIGFTTQKTMMVAGEKIKIEVVTTQETKSRGLSNLDSMPIGSGMLFVYDEYIIPSFWMKEMRFPIDIIWIKDDLIMGYEKNIYPQNHDEKLTTYQPKTFVNYVLEVNSGFVDKYDIKIGDSVSF